MAPKIHSTGVLRYHSWTSACELPDGSTEPLFRGAKIPLVDSRLCCFLATAEAPYPVKHRAACSDLFTKLHINDGCASTTGYGYYAATGVIWWWNAVLRLHYLMIICHD